MNRLKLRTISLALLLLLLGFGLVSTLFSNLLVNVQALPSAQEESNIPRVPENVSQDDWAKIMRSMQLPSGDSKLWADTGSSSDAYGHSIDTNNGYLVVGAPYMDPDGNSEMGSVSVYKADDSDTGWSLFQTLMPSDGKAGDNFGFSVAVYGNTIAASSLGGDPEGANEINVNEAGVVYIFETDGSGQFVETKILSASDAKTVDKFGYSIGLYEDTLAVGSPESDIAYDAQGAVYVYTRDKGGDDNWGLEKKLFSLDANTSDMYGTAVAIQGDNLIVGSPEADIGVSTNQGAAYIYSRDTGGPDNWGQTVKLTSTDGSINNYFGAAVDIYQNSAIIGSWGTNGNAGAAYVFEKDNGGEDAWGQNTKVVANDGSIGDRFGTSVSLSGSTLAIGAFGKSVDGNSGQGQAYVYQRYQGGEDNWGQVVHVSATDGGVNENLGFSVTVNEEYIISGAPKAAIGESEQQGAVYVIRWQTACTTRPGSATDLADAINNTACNPIYVPPGIYGGCYELSHDAVIYGDGADETILDGENICTTVTVKSGITATMKDMTITGGNGTDGGGIDNNGGDLTLRDVIVEGNTSFFGGGINNDGEGINRLTIYSSSLNNNTGSARGGAIYNGAESIVNLYNVTMSTNISAEGAGLNTAGEATLYNTTIAKNSTDGIRQTDGTLTLANTLLAENATTNCSLSAGTVVSMGNNLADDESCNFSGTDDVVVADAKLQAFADNGGVEKTHALHYTSPALNAGNNTICTNEFVESVDQRGIARPYGETCDIGAVEMASTACNVTANDAASLQTHLSDSECNPILVPAGLYEGCFTLNHHADIIGDGADITTFKADSDCSAFKIDPDVNTNVEAITFTGGNATEGGGIDNNGGDLRLEDVVIDDNKAQVGGGLDNDDGGTVTIISSTVSNNEASSKGGGINNGPDSTVNGWNSTLSSNTSPIGGGFNNEGDAGFVNSTFAKNDVDGIYNNGGGEVNLANTIIAESTGSNCINIYGGIMSQGANMADDDTCYLTGSGDRVVADVKLLSLAMYGGTEPTHKLHYESPAINVANDAVCAAPEINNVDQRGINRPFGSQCDIGAYEADTLPCNVAADSGQGLETALSDITCSPVILPPGTYTGCFVLTHDTEIIGSGSHNTILQGDGTCTTVTVNSDVNAQLFDLGITGGNGLGSSGSAGTDGATLAGGGLANKNANVYLEDIEIYGNVAGTGAGIANLAGSSLEIVSSTIAYNDAVTVGGGIYNESKLTSWNSTISSNNAPTGAGIYNKATVSLTNNTIAMNNKDGFHNSGGSVTFVNTLFAEQSGSNCVYVGGSFTSLGYNLSDDTTCGLGATGDIFNPEPQIQSLNMYDAVVSRAASTTQNERTHMLLEDSEAIDAGSRVVCDQAKINGEDQRGAVRSGQCDIGAVEMDDFHVYIPITVNFFESSTNNNSDFISDDDGITGGSDSDTFWFAPDSNE